MSKKSTSAKADRRNTLQTAIDNCYTLAVSGVPGVPIINKSINELAEDYLKHHQTKEKAAQKLIQNQIKKIGSTGLIAGLGNPLSHDLSSKLDIVMALFMQIRMVAAIAYIGGYDVHNDEVITQIKACILTNAIADITKDAGIKIVPKLAIQAINAIPIESIRAINKAAGLTLITKRAKSRKGAINLIDLLPVISAAIVAGVDALSTKIIADKAYKTFICSDEELVIPTTLS